MAGLHGKHTRVLVGAYNLSGYLSEVSMPTTKGKAPCSGFGQDSHTYVMGLADTPIAMSGYGHFGTDEVDQVLAAALDDTTDVAIPFSWGVDRFTVGTRVKMAAIKQTDYEISASRDDAVAISASATADGDADHNGIALHGISNEAGNSSAAAQDNAAGTTNGAVGHLHVTVDAGTGLAVVIEHSTDGSTWAPLITFTTTNGVTSERIAVTGTVNRYVRATWTRSSGNFTFAVALARR
jgi:hypothetical protein